MSVKAAVTPPKRSFTPTRQLSGKPMKFRTWADYSTGDILICKYVKTTPNKYNDSKPNHVVEIVEAFLKDKKVQAEWVEGTHVCLNTSGMLDKSLSNVSSGDMIQITYNGSAVMEKGKFAGKEAHGFDVVMIEEDGTLSDESEEEFDL